MRISSLGTSYFFSLLFLAGVGAIFLLLPFVTALLVAGILATLFRPLHKWFSQKVRMGESWASFVSCIVILLIIVIPFVLIVGLMTKEIRGALSYIETNPEVIETARQWVGNVTTQIPFGENLNISTVLERGGNVALDVLQKTYTGVSAFFFWLFIMFFALFYFFIDGKRIVEKVMHLSPLKDHQERMLMKEFSSISRATLKGTVVIGLIQGTLGGLLFWLVGVPSPVTWGVVMIILSIIPVVGSGLVWTPVGVAMLFTGSVWQGIVILAFGFGVISVIDNILRPKLVGRDSQMHPLLVLLATLGGIIAFGIVGFIIGPIIFALFLALLRIYEEKYSEELDGWNESDV